MADERQFYSTREVAIVFLRMNPNTLVKALWDGRVTPPVRGPGRAFLWTREDIRRAAEQLGRNMLELEATRT